MPGALTLTARVTWTWPGYCLIGALNDAVICGVLAAISRCRAESSAVRRCAQLAENLGKRRKSREIIVKLVS